MICSNGHSLNKENLYFRPSGKGYKCRVCHREYMKIRRQNKLIKKEPSLYRIWANIIQRCTNPKSKSYNNYGGRGIQVFKPWLDFKRFESDIISMIGSRPGTSKEYQLDRINNNDNYCPGNIRWSTISQNNLNKRPIIQCHSTKALLKELERRGVLFKNQIHVEDVPSTQLEKDSFHSN